MFETGHSSDGLETIKNINDICAACLLLHESGRTSNMQDMLPVRDKIEIYKILESISMFKYSERTPQLLCSTCLYKLVNIYEFQQTCNKSYFCIDNYIKWKDAQDACKMPEDVETNAANEPFIEEVGDNNFIEESLENEQKQTLDNEESISTSDGEDVTTKFEIEDTEIHGLESDSEESPKSTQECSTEIQESVEFTASQSSHLDRHSKEHLSLAKKGCHVDKKSPRSCTQIDLNEDVRNFKCDFCESTFKSKRGLSGHKRIHAAKKTFKCTQCGEAFASSNYLTEHAKTHTTEEPFCCELCAETFKEKQALTLHMAHTHPLLRVALTTDMPEPLNNDDEISKTSKKITHVSLESEIGRKDTIEEDGVMNERNKIDHQASTSVELTDAHPEDHVGVDKKESCNNKRKDTSGEFVCKYCDKVLSKKKALIFHERLHTGERPFKCDQCAKAFVSSNVLNIHKQTHRTERPFVCSICTKAFKLKGDLKSHMEIHVNVRSYVCSICSKAFKRRAYLRQHRRLQHLPCKLSDNKYKELTTLRPHTENQESVQMTASQSEGTTKVSPESEIVRTDTIEGGGVINERNRIDHQASTSVELTDAHPKDHVGVDKKESCKNKRKDTSGEFVCKYCDKVLSKKKALIFHERLHTGERPFKCDQCAKAFVSSNVLNIHKKTHRTERPFVCSICTKAFKVKDDLKSHMQIHVNVRSYVCSICSKAFKRRAYLRHHSRIHINDDDENQPLPCKLCDNKYKEVTNLRPHTENQESVQMTASQSEGTTKVSPESEIVRTDTIEGGGVINDRNGVDHPASTSVELTEHDSHPEEHLGSDKRENCICKRNAARTRFVCKYCNRVFRRKATLNNHERLHTGERPFKCSQCPKTFVTRDALDRHMATTYSTERPFCCELCGKTFQSMAALTIHKSRHVNARSYVCSICSKGFNTNRSLYCHMKIHSNGVEKPYKCTECPKTFASRTSVRRHKLNHTTERPFDCNVCEKAFRTKADLELHMAIHVNARSHVCPICSKAFNQPANLRQHKLVHRLENKFACKLCDRKYKAEKNLKRHMLTHSGIRSHVCTICNKGFFEKGTLNSHLRTHDK